MRPIDADAALKALRKCQTYIYDTRDPDLKIKLSSAKAAINNLPTIQPEPKEGHWINGKCDLCGEHAPFWCMASTYHESDYCPNCGAKMTISTK